MKLATVRLPDTGGTRTVAVRLDGAAAVETGQPDVGTLLATVGLDGAARADGPRHLVQGLDFAPVVPRPGKIVCVGLNYRAHILEMKRDLPRFPTLFAKFADCLLGDGDDIVLPPESPQVDWEGELTVVIGRTVRRADADQARGAIAGYTIANDVSMRDWQFRTREWLQGKAWADSTPIGPYMATPDEIPERASMTLSVDGVVKQHGDIHDLVHDPVDLVRYVSVLMPLRPGDLILTGTPGGVGHAREPQSYLAPGQTVTVTIDGIGTLTNRTVAETVEGGGHGA